MSAESDPGLLRIALETSGPVGSVAVAAGSDVLGRVFLMERGAHAGNVVPAIQAALDEGGVLRSEIRGVVVGEGPGSFTGVRIAAATAKGLAHALAVPLWTVSSLAAAAATDLVLPRGVEPWSVPPDMEGLADTPGSSAPRYVLFDARGDRVYAACYRFGSGLDILARPAATTLGDVLAGPLPTGVCFLGDGAVRHRDRIQELGYPVLPPPAGVPTGDGLLHVLASTEDPRPVTDAWRWEPNYLRPSGAERSQS